MAKASAPKAKKEPKPTKKQVDALMDLFMEATQKGWPMTSVIAALHKQGVTRFETCLVSAASWFDWKDGTHYEYKDKWFKPYDVAPKGSKAKVSAVAAYAQKNGMDYMKFLDDMAAAGSHKYICELDKGSFDFFRVNDQGKNLLLGSFAFTV